MNTAFIGFAVLAFLAIVLLIESIYLFWSSHHGPVVKRMDERIRALSAGGNVSAEQLSILKQRMLSESPLVTRLLMVLPRVHTLDRQLQQSGLTWSVARFVTYTLLFALTGLFIGIVLHAPWTVMFGLAGASALLPLMILRRKRGKRVLQARTATAGRCRSDQPCAACRSLVSRCARDGRRRVARAARRRVRTGVR